MPSPNASQSRGGFQRSFQDQLLTSQSFPQPGVAPLRSDPPIGGGGVGAASSSAGSGAGRGGSAFAPPPPPPPPPMPQSVSVPTAHHHGSAPPQERGDGADTPNSIELAGLSSASGEESRHHQAHAGCGVRLSPSGASGDSGHSSAGHFSWYSRFEKGKNSERSGGGAFRSFVPWRLRRRSGEDDKLGTMEGVFLPCMSQILGVIFFLRLPTITGQAGSVGATLIIFTSVLSTFVTSLSLSAIATNGTIQAGGPYYIISRTLGVEIGGSLGMLFYLGTTLGSSMYVLGAVEALNTNLNDYGAAAYEAEEEAIDDLVAFYEIDDDDDLIDDAVALAEQYAAEREDRWFGMMEIMSLSLMFILALVVSVGMKYVNMSANFFLLIVFISIGSILLGTVLFAAKVWNGSLHPDMDRALWSNIWPHYSPDLQTNVTPNFCSLLALFYPSVTGIMAGTNRSAKLATPGESIPKGTIGAIAVTTTLYVIQVWLLGSVVTHRTLLENKLVVASIAWPNSVTIKVGIITACVGAGLQCLTGAPQLLAAIAADGAIPLLKFVDQGDREPTIAIWVTWAIASLATLAGNLDHITPIITMFFLLMYGGINLCCFLLGWVHAPGFRPTFRYFHKHVSLLGFVWCLGMAMVISWQMALAAIGLIGLGYYYIYRRQEQLPEEEEQQEQDIIGADWGVVGDSLRYKLTTMVLLRVTGTENFHAKNWRPQLLTVVDTDDMGHPLEPQLLSLASQIQKKGRGLNMMVTIKRGSLLKPGAFDASQEVRSVLKRHMKAEGIVGFASVSVTHAGFCEAVLSAVTHSGLGPVSPNLVLMNWDEDWRRRPEREKHLIDVIRGLCHMKRAVVLFKGCRDSYPRHGDVVPNGVIDIYWVVEDGGLLLLLPYILSKHKIWRGGVRLRVFAVKTNPRQGPEDLERSVSEHLRVLRIKASVSVIDMSGTGISADMTGDGCDGHVDLGVWRTMTIDEAFSGTPAGGGGGHEVMITRTLSEGAYMQSEEEQMHTARTFNIAIRQHSRGSNLVVTNMPLVQSMSGSSAFVAYLDAVSDGVENMLFVRGSEFEVVTAVA